MGLHAKLYSLDVPNKQSHIKVKGVKKHYAKKNVRHDDFLAALRQNKSYVYDVDIERFIYKFEHDVLQQNRLQI